MQRKWILCLFLFFISEPAFADFIMSDRAWDRAGKQLIGGLFFWIIAGSVFFLVPWVFRRLRKELENKKPSKNHDKKDANHVLTKSPGIVSEPLPKVASRQQITLTAGEKKSLAKIIRMDSYGNKSWIKSVDYTKREREIAVLFFKERGVIEIANTINLQSIALTATRPKVSKLEFFEQQLAKAYVNLTDAEHELMPLFFSPDMSSSKSIYLTNPKIRDICYRAFQRLIKSDGLGVRVLKKRYLEENSYHYLLPLSAKLDQ